MDATSPHRRYRTRARVALDVGHCHVPARRAEATRLVWWARVFGYIELFHQLGFSPTVAVLVTIGEFFGGLGLIVGLLSRVAAAGIGVIMVRAVLTVNGQYGFFMNWAGNQTREGFEFHILAVGLAIGILILGGGKWSIDRALTAK